MSGSLAPAPSSNSGDTGFDYQAKLQGGVRKSALKKCAYNIIKTRTKFPKAKGRQSPLLGLAHQEQTIDNAIVRMEGCHVPICYPNRG